MPFVYTPKVQAEYGDFWHEHNRERAEKTPKVDTSQIPSFHQIYTQADAKAAQEQRREEIAASPYAFTGQGMPMTPAQREAWKKEFFKEH